MALGEAHREPLPSHRRHLRSQDRGPPRPPSPASPSLSSRELVQRPEGTCVSQAHTAGCGHVGETQASCFLRLSSTFTLWR